MRPSLADQTEKFHRMPGNTTSLVWKLTRQSHFVNSIHTYACPPKSEGNYSIFPIGLEHLDGQLDVLACMHGRQILHENTGRSGPTMYYANAISHHVGKQAGKKNSYCFLPWVDSISTTAMLSQ